MGFQTLHHQQPIRIQHFKHYIINNQSEYSISNITSSTTNQNTAFQTLHHQQPIRIQHFKHYLINNQSEQHFKHYIINNQSEYSISNITSSTTNQNTAFQTLHHQQQIRIQHFKHYIIN